MNTCPLHGPWQTWSTGKERVSAFPLHKITTLVWIEWNILSVKKTKVKGIASTFSFVFPQLQAGRASSSEESNEARIGLDAQWTQSCDHDFHGFHVGQPRLNPKLEAGKETQKLLLMCRITYPKRILGT